jgi:hypothetical protein
MSNSSTSRSFFAVMIGRVAESELQD